MHDGNGWLILPVSGPSGRIRGDIKRRPNSECPLYVNSSHYDGQPKVVTYFSAAHPGLAWYTLRVGVSCSAVLVEDQISAMRVAASGLAHGVALLGTGMNYEKVRELQETVDNVVIALDADATSLAFQHAAKWGAAFKRCRVLCLREDIKDAHNMEHVSAILASL
jgi:DNA primase